MSRSGMAEDITVNAHRTNVLTQQSVTLLAALSQYFQLQIVIEIHTLKSINATEFCAMLV